MKTFVYIGIIGASALLLASCKGKSKPMETPVPSISVSTPIVRDITLTKEYPGYLSSQLKVDLVARVNGYLRTSYLKAGSRVKKGDLIFVIEPDTYQDNVTQAEASVKTSKAQLEYARSNYERMKEAAKSGAVSQIQVIQAEATVSESEAAVKNAEAELNTARTNLSYCYIRAPFDGAVTRASYDIGNYINGAVQPVTLATLYKDDLMFANFLSPNIDLSTGTLNVRANLDNPKHVLKSGLYVTITLPYAEQPDAVLVRDASIGTDQLGKYLYIVNDSNVVRYRPIEVGQLVSAPKIPMSLLPCLRYGMA